MPRLDLSTCRAPALLLGLWMARMGAAAASGDARPEDRVTTTHSAESAVIENSRVRVAFDLARGTWSATEKPDKATALGDAFVRVGPWTSTEPGRVQAASSREASDALGRGRTLAIESARPGQPTLVLEITLYDGQGFVALGAGLANVTQADVRVKEFYPLSGARVFPSVKTMADSKTLNGPAGGLDTRVAKGPYCSSPNNLLLTCVADGRRRSLVAGGLTYHDFLKWAGIGPQSDVFGMDTGWRGAHAVKLAAPVAEQPPPEETLAGAKAFLTLKAADPVGRLVEAGSRYVAGDRFYVDFVTPDPFIALEQYGQRMRLAQGAQPNPYDFATICSWYAGVWKTRGAQNHPEKSKYKIATTAGQVEEMDFLRKIGVTKYTRVALRLVPDNYVQPNMNGWFDDEHWRAQGFYTPPYETTEKWGRALQERGGMAYTYFQPTVARANGISIDFRRAHPELMLGKSPDRTIDYTHPEAQDHMRKVYANLRRGPVVGIMFDYCDDLWFLQRVGARDAGWSGDLAQGGFADPHATAASAYRLMFQLAKEGLGPQSWIHERAIENPASDITAGIVDSQRFQWDSDKIYPALIASSGVRWYKNRVLFAYDMDGKDLLAGWKHPSFTGTDQDGRRMMLTMCYVAASRLLLTHSLRDVPPQAIHDLLRTLPYPTEPRSARPVDAFSGKAMPQVYDFAASPHWHQVVLFNDSMPTRPLEVSVALSGQSLAGSLGLEPRREYYVYDFWNDCLVARLAGTARLAQTLRPGEARMLSVRVVEERPQALSTNRHLMQGYVDMIGPPAWDEATATLRGTSSVIGGETYKIVLATNGHRPIAAAAPGAKASLAPAAGSNDLTVLSLDVPQNAAVPWSVTFAAKRGTSR